jgi:hypothetical protein
VSCVSGGSIGDPMPVDYRVGEWCVVKRDTLPSLISSPPRPLVSCCQPASGYHLPHQLFPFNLPTIVGPVRAVGKLVDQ